MSVCEREQKREREREREKERERVERERARESKREKERETERRVENGHKKLRMCEREGACVFALARSHMILRHSTYVTRVCTT